MSQKRQITARTLLDDLPKCQLSGIGISINSNYANANLRNIKYFEDCSLSSQLDTNIYLYGIFDGYKGAEVANSGLQTLVTELLLSQVIQKCSDEEIKETIRQAFSSVEKNYMESIDDLLAKRASLLCEVPNSLPTNNESKKYANVFEKLKNINHELSVGSDAVVGLIFNDKLYIGNIGNCRALLCKTDENSVLRVIQISVDHDVRNEDELLRLSQLGIDTSKMRYGCHLGNQKNTRCLGNFMVKSCYREFPELKNAVGEPVISEPEINGGISLDENCRFLIFTSSGVIAALERVLSANEVNKYVAQLVVEQFRVQKSLRDVAQAVVDKIISRWSNLVPENSSEDMTLIVRNFNFSLPNEARNVSETMSSVATTNSDSTNCDINAENYMYDDNIRLKAYVDFSDYYINVGRNNSK